MCNWSISTLCAESRRICVELYKAIQKLRPDWHHDDDDKGTMKIVMSGSASDTLNWQKHIRSKKRREELAKAFKNPKKPFRIVIVRDMWLTGFDAPSLHTMYVDKPMRGHALLIVFRIVSHRLKNGDRNGSFQSLSRSCEVKRCPMIPRES